MQQITLNELLANPSIHTAPDNVDVFMTHYSDNGCTRIFKTGEEQDYSWISLEDAKKKAEDLKCKMYIDREGAQELTQRIAQYNKATEIISMRNKLVHDAFVGEQAELRWKSNSRCVPEHVFKEAMVELPALQKELENADDQAAMAEYIEGQKNRTPEQIAEERAGARAAFGPGKEIVNAITGEKFRT